MRRISRLRRQDEGEAAKWYQKSAEQGYVVARHNLGYLYSEGRGVARDYAEAAKWYRLAAAQKYASSQNNLGMFYLNGRGVEQDYVIAYMWFELAAAGKSANAPKNREAAAAKMTAEQIAQAKALAEQCKALNYRECDKLQAKPNTVGFGLQ